MRNILEYLEQIPSPEKRAVGYREESYTFRELTAAAKRIGAAIPSGRFRAIGVMAGRSIRTLAYFLGVLYSGNFFVPIDPDLPAEKMRAIFADAQIDVLLGDPELFPSSQTYDGIYLSIQDAGEGLCSLPNVGGDDPMYLIYTSGSTGKPKGVLKSHRAAISFIEAYCETFSFCRDEIIGNQTPFFFDAALKDILMMLKLGCTLEILPSALFTLPPELIDYLNEKQVTFVSWVPTALSLVAQLNPFSVVKPVTLKRVFFVGEVMPMKHLNRWRMALPDVQYVNLYGQSELAGVCCHYEVAGEFDDAAVLPIGRPLPNCRVYLLDEGKRITEPDHIGELYLVSDALASEYYNDPEKTAASFPTLDFGEGPVRCFKTGDLARYNAAGELLFAARTDFQIKHMGRRIELGEIEAVAGALPEIRRCCCLYQAEKRKLVLFCETSDRGVTAAGLRKALKPRLSDYMLPGKIIIMEKLPVNANGKLDRQALKETIR